VQWLPTLIDPAGFRMENYDRTGKYRTTKNGKPVDAKGNFTSTLDIDGPFEGGKALAEKIAGSLEAKQCLTLQAYRWAVGSIAFATHEDNCPSSPI